MVDPQKMTKSGFQQRVPDFVKKSSLYHKKMINFPRKAIQT